MVTEEQNQWLEIYAYASSTHLRFFPVVAKMSLNKQLFGIVLFLGLSMAQEAYFLYKDPLGVMVNYTGSIELGNIPHGFGIGHFMDENPTYTYTGEWKHGLATGFGKIRYANGDTYVGKVNFITFFKVRFFSIISFGFSGHAQWLKITEKVAFNIASEASYVYILNGQKFIKNTKIGQILRGFEKR